MKRKHLADVRPQIPVLCSDPIMPVLPNYSILVDLEQDLAEISGMVKG